MNWMLLSPAAVAIAVGLAAGILHRRLRPALAAVAFSAFAATAAVAVVGAIIILASLTLARVPWIAQQVAWCQAITSAHDLPGPISIGVVLGAVAMAVSALQTVRRHRASRGAATSGELFVLATDEPTAYAVPGRPGQVVVSVGMLRNLDAQERRVLLAHERAHLDHQHHRYLWAAELAAAVVPLLRPLTSRVRFATERWADEEAAREVGDRSLVARTICRAALLQHDGERPALALAGLGVTARVEALLHDSTPTGRLRLLWNGSAAAAFAAAVAAASWQLHHMMAFAAHVCRLA